METVTLDETSIGCWLEGARGHYLSRDVIQQAQHWGFIVGPFEEWALETYEAFSHDDKYPNEGIIELADDAIKWLNSGQDKCQECAVGSGDIRPGKVPISNKDKLGHHLYTSWVICKACSGSGRGPREKFQNFPPIIPEGTAWAFEEGEFGLWRYDDDGNVTD